MADIVQLSGVVPDGALAFAKKALWWLLVAVASYTASLFSTLRWEFVVLLTIAVLCGVAWMTDRFATSWRRLRPAPAIRQAAIPIPSAQSSPPLDADARWLRQIADQDDREAGHRLLDLPAYAKPFLAAPEPYLEIHVPLINATVFQFTVDERVEGVMSWGDHPLNSQARILSPGMEIPHASRSEVILRQHVSPEMARLIEATPDPYIGTASCHLLFRYEYKGLTKTARRAIAHQVAVEWHEHIRLFYDQSDPNCFQPGGRVTVSGVGERSETIYRVGVRTQRPIVGCKFILEDVDPKPVDPGMQRIGLALTPRQPSAGEPSEFRANPNAPAYVEVLQELAVNNNPGIAATDLRLLYAAGQYGSALTFERNNYVLIFRLEGPDIKEPVRISIDANYDGRLGRKRWQVRTSAHQPTPGTAPSSR